MDKEVDTAREFAERMAGIMKSILESGLEAMPLCFARRKDGKSMMIGFEFPESDNEKSKDVAGIAMQILASDPGVDYVVFLSDAWYASFKKGEYEQADLSGGVRGLPQRKETIIVSLFGQNRLTELGQWHYERVDGKPVFEPTMEWMVPDEAYGRFAVGNTGGSKQ